MMRLLPLVICWLCVPINIGLYWAFLVSASNATKNNALWYAFDALCFVQIFAGIVGAVMAPKKEGSSRAPAIVLGVFGAMLGFTALVTLGMLPLVVNL